MGKNIGSHFRSIPLQFSLCKLEVICCCNESSDINPFLNATLSPVVGIINEFLNSVQTKSLCWKKDFGFVSTALITLQAAWTRGTVNWFIMQTWGGNVKVNII